MYLQQVAEQANSDVPSNLRRTEPDFNAPRESAAISRPVRSSDTDKKRTYEIHFCAQRVCFQFNN